MTAILDCRNMTIVPAPGVPAGLFCDGLSLLTVVSETALGLTLTPEEARGLAHHLLRELVALEQAGADASLAPAGHA